jgi:hypothetical protein
MPHVCEQYFQHNSILICISRPDSADFLLLWKNYSNSFFAFEACQFLGLDRIENLNFPAATLVECFLSLQRRGSEKLQMLGLGIDCTKKRERAS